MRRRVEHVEAVREATYSAPPPVQGLDQAQRLQVWECARGASAHERALILLRAAWPGSSMQAAATMPLGRRDALLLSLRIATYGDRAPAYLQCSHCGEGLEDELDLNRIRLDPPGGPDDDGRRPHTLGLGEVALTLRLPTTEDLIAVARVGGLGRAQLLERVVLRACRGDEEIGPETLAAVEVEAIEQELERLDPQAHIVFSQRCPACGDSFETPFDIASYLWHELDVDARRLLQEIDAIARTYGWSEAEILALSPMRRRTYLEMVTQR